AAEAGDRHVGKRVQPVEHDAVAAKHAPVVLLELFLTGRQGRPLRVVYQVEDKAGVRMRIAGRVQFAQRAQARLKYASTTLTIDVVLEIARQRCDHLHAVGGEKGDQLFLPGLLGDGEVAAVHDVHAERARLRDEIAKMRVELRRSARDIERGHAREL